jgi:hypothetical protein
MRTPADRARSEYVEPWGASSKPAIAQFCKLGGIVPWVKDKVVVAKLGAAGRTNTEPFWWFFKLRITTDRADVLLNL